MNTLYSSPPFFPVSPTFFFYFARKGCTFAGDMKKKVVFILAAAARAASSFPKAESKIITILPTSDGKNYVVTGGLAVGDVIVSKGAGYVKEGQKVVDVPKINGNHVSSLAFR